MSNKRPGRPSGRPKTGGRKKGTLNKVTTEQKDRAEKILQLIESQFLEQDIAKLSPASRTSLYRDILEYRQPKLARVEMTGKDGADLELKQVFIIGGKEIVL